MALLIWLLLRIQLLTRIQLWLCPYETIDSLISDECKRALFLITKIAVINALAKTVESYIDYQMSTLFTIENALIFCYRWHNH
ncbi:hypothetical protein GLOIN_2v1575974 [Rhizophagus irregularis DAOM 181602=DAOM 197198]|uniref:Secreted protein n=1 Tax=Rhizophagus irregularis (strain DAOM 181602 / DAOM 197198 / MUCL 43194) TaxID=747089 RepID=A0A2P4Q9Z7_RHIID|nr:hypothetical protein GLOIN_2v1575974 [Rhizophagus irregularis DAOM 181602=DAOM 197198]POG74463.1 hypothetical protein GLOIN_2v1575974 [Rhizophagus irregularis DAOM 181602=DAOM 197198]|eukprot:XP_025181329.1 hypothetical protein GLOIN_2v1575974 [Rhizophagus irregularis DAOM 181602=DAOM 197198]